MKKEEKAKVGRPKLADSSTKKNAYISICISLVLTLMLVIGGTFSLIGGFDVNNLKGSVSTITLAENTLYGEDSKKVCSYSVIQKGKKVYLKWDCRGKNKFNSFHIKGGDSSSPGSWAKDYYVNIKGDNESEGSLHLIGSQSGELQNGETYTIKPKISKLEGNNYTFTGGEAKITFTVGERYVSNPTSRTLYGKDDEKICSYSISQKGKKVYLNWDCTGKNKFYSFKIEGGDTSKAGSFKKKYYSNVKASKQKKYSLHLIGSQGGELQVGKTYTIIPKIGKKEGNNEVYKNGVTKITYKVKPSYFTVKYVGNGAKGSMKDLKVTYGVATPLTKNSFKYENYAFDGWNAYKIEGQNHRYLCINSKNKTYWTEKGMECKSGYTLKKYKNRGNVKFVVSGGETVYMLATWIKDNSSAQQQNSSEKQETDNSVIKESVITTATPKPSNKNAFLIVYNSNGGTGTMKNQEIIHGKKTNLSKLGFKNGSSKFEGWIVKRAKDGYYRGYNSSNKIGWYKNPVRYELYTDGQSVAITVGKGETVYMIAQWSNETSKFIVNSVGNNCYTVTPPKNTDYWKVHTYYKSASSSYFGSNKISDLSYNHYNDKVETQMICFKKQKYNSESYRLLVKVTTGPNDKVKGSISSWRPNGWSINSSIGWSYKDFNVK